MTSPDNILFKIDNMDFSLLSLDTIAKLPRSKQSAGSTINEILKNHIDESDLDFLKSLLKDEIYESDQLEFMKRIPHHQRGRRPKNIKQDNLNQSSRVHNQS